MPLLFPNQPRAFTMVFLLELWERFGYYTVQGVLTLFFIRYLGYSDHDSYFTFGAFSALVYGLVVFGGYLGDRVLGTKRTIILGLIVLSCGYLSLAFTDKEHVFLALGLICVGNGLFKANPSNLLSKCYEENDPRLHSGFTLYYMSINLGSIVALTVGPAVASHYGYSYTYLLSGIGLLLGLLNYYVQRHYVADINSEADKRRISFVHWLLVVIGVVLTAFACSYLLQHIALAKNLLSGISLFAVLYYFYLMKGEHKSTVLKMMVAFALMLQAVIFFTLYQQMPTSLNLFAVHNVIPNIFGITFDPQSFQALNPIWIVLMSPLLAYAYTGLNKKGFLVAVPYKFALGMTLCGFSFLVLYFARFFYTGNGMVSSWWLIASYLFQSLGELLVSALGVAMVAELVPPRITGFVMGLWFLTSAVAGFLGAEVAAFTSLPQNIHPGLESLQIYTHVFAGIGIVTLIISLIMWIIAPLLSRYINTKEVVEKKDLESVAFSTTYIAGL
ncbi:MAG: oligopeptide:H+ symporter [Legionella sp.]|jgi:POT family proton-dependent oligopeptide transporter